MPVQKTKKPAKKAVAKPIAGKNGKSPNGKNGRPAVKAAAIPAPPPRLSAPPEPRPDAKLQYKTFERGIQLLHKRNYSQAKEMFEKARQGPSLEISSNAQSHVRMCERRMAAPPPEPKSAEEFYNFGVALINLRKLDQARRHLIALFDIFPPGDPRVAKARSTLSTLLF